MDSENLSSLATHCSDYNEEVVSCKYTLQGKFICFTYYITLQINNNELPENRMIATTLGKEKNFERYMKRVMPFVQVMREKMELRGLSALNLTLDFDEFSVLQNNKKYLENTLDVSNKLVSHIFV